MNRVFRTVLAPYDVALLLQAVAAESRFASLSFGWSSPVLNASGTPTHYIFSGMLLVSDVETISNAVALQAALAGLVDVSLGEAEAICGLIDISDAEAADVVFRHGLLLPIERAADGIQ